jgi:aminodeoxyfutalosine synthase
MAGASTEQHISRGELERILREAGYRPVERDTLYRPLGEARAVPA